LGKLIAMSSEGGNISASAQPGDESLECIACAYDLTAIVDGGRCPECGLARSESVAAPVMVAIHIACSGAVARVRSWPWWTLLVLALVIAVLETLWRVVMFGIVDIPPGFWIIYNWSDEFLHAIRGLAIVAFVFLFVAASTLRRAVRQRLVLEKGRATRQ